MFVRCRAVNGVGLFVFLSRHFASHLINKLIFMHSPHQFATFSSFESPDALFSAIYCTVFDANLFGYTWVWAAVTSILSTHLFSVHYMQKSRFFCNVQ